MFLQVWNKKQWLIWFPQYLRQMEMTTFLLAEGIFMGTIVKYLIKKKAYGPIINKKMWPTTIDHTAAYIKIR